MVGSLVCFVCNEATDISFVLKFFEIKKINDMFFVLSRFRPLW